jgi:hypothetical protein
VDGVLLRLSDQNWRAPVSGTARVLAMVTILSACDGSFGGEPSKTTCDLGDCGGLAAIIWGTIPIRQQQLPAWRANPPTLEMTLFRNGIALPSGAVSSAWNGGSRCNSFAGPAIYCANIQDPGQLCGPEPFRIEGPDPELCLSAYVSGDDFPLLDGDTFRLLAMLQGTPIVDDQFVAIYTDREMPAFCENRHGLRCRFARHRFVALP